MNKALTQLLVFVCAFFMLWALLAKINFTGLFRINELKAINEEKIGELIREAIYQDEDILEDSCIVSMVDSIKLRICTANSIRPDSVQIHIVQKDEANAFALPDKNLVLYSGLITFCKTPEELASVIAHEIAHMEHHHVMKKLVKQVGISVMFNLLGGENSRVIKEIAGTLSSSAYDRELEREADKTAVLYLEKAQINPEYFANLLLAFGKKSSTLPKEFYWISSHPESKERAGLVLQLKNKSLKNYYPVIATSTWNEAKRRAKE